MQVWSWLFLTSQELTLVLWTGASLLLYVFAANFAWILRSVQRERVGRIVSTLMSWDFRELAQQGLRLAYYLGIPYLALLGGVTDRRLMGLGPIQWQPAAQSAAIVGGGGVVLWVLASWQHARATEFAPFPTSLTRASAVGAGTWSLALLEPVYLQAHWSFYRSGPMLVTGDLYLGVFLGLGLVLLEGLSNPYLRHQLSRPGHARGVLPKAGLAVLTALIFLATQSLWYCLAVHLGFEISVWAVRRMARLARSA